VRPLVLRDGRAPWRISMGPGREPGAEESSGVRRGVVEGGDVGRVKEGVRCGATAVWGRLSGRAVSLSEHRVRYKFSYL
jgi:hypothetical protein